MPGNTFPLSDPVASRTSTRNETSPQSTPKLDDLEQLVRLFPDIDRDYARMCLQSYSRNRVASVTEKLLDRNFSNYPRHNFRDSYIDKNALLDDLNELFPEHDVTELRQALSIQSSSNVYRAIDDLLENERQLERNKSKVTVRTRIGLDRGVVQPHQRFRSEEYQVAVYKRLRLEFAQHDSPSTIRAVLSEHNYDYERAKAALSGLFTKKTLWSIFKSLFSSKAKEVAENQLRGNPTTGCAELDSEIAAIALRKRRIEDMAQIQQDLVLAKTFNETEHVEADAMIECGCCYGEYTWDDITSCNGGHLVCRGCVTHTVQECAFGQGDNSYDGRGLRCIAVSNENCDHVIPSTTLEGIVSTELMEKLTARIIATELESANVNLVHCPFCLYAEFKEPVQKIRLRTYYKRVFMVFLCWITLFAPLILANITIPIIICIEYTNLFEWKDWEKLTNSSYQRMYGGIQESARTFKCRNQKDCGRESCLECCKEWAPFHDCLKDEKDGLRLYVEKAMADAVKRTCPRCNVGFIKSDGCNLMHCRCGFVMCYICRQDVEQLGYSHFCQHFRPLGGPCKICTKCGLYDNEDEEEAVREASIRATQEYLTRHPASVNAIRSTRDPHLALRRNIAVPRTIQGNHILEEFVDFIMEYGKDLLFEEYALG